MEICVRINGEDYCDDVEPRLLLVHFLRGQAGLTGTHIGCDTGNCGACTVHLDGTSVKSCMVLAVQANEREVTTIEGVSDGTGLHPLQTSFVEHFGFQCGFCTPGMIMSGLALLASNPAPADADVREALEGNLCMCTGYQQIVDSILHVACAAVDSAAPPLAARTENQDPAVTRAEGTL